MSNAKRILRRLDELLDSQVDITMYGRAALCLGYDNPPEEWAGSKDIDIVLWLGQAEELAGTTNFWDAIGQVNKEFEQEGLFISHLFEETQTVLRPNWRRCRISITGDWKYLKLFRLADEDLFLTKLMRDDPVDEADASFITGRAGWTRKDIERILAQARVPNIAEIQEQFKICSRKYRGLT